MQEITLNVDGMTCHGCENRLKKALETIDGVLEVTADYQTKKVNIKLAKEVAKETLISKIEDIGFVVL